MNLLLDTRALIWFVAGDRRLGRAAPAAVEHERARVYVSAASIWEMAIKSARKRLELSHRLERYVADRLNEGYAVLPVDWAHAVAVERLPFHHQDPFDRLLAAQALAADMPLVTRDRVFRKTFFLFGLRGGTSGMYVRYLKGPSVGTARKSWPSDGGEHFTFR